MRGSVARGLLGAGVAERGQIETSQQMLSRAEQHRGNRQVHLVDEPLLQILVAGITLTSFYAPNGWFGQYLVPYGIQGVFSPLGITIALIFIGLPFVVRTLQPVIADLDVELEEVATSLGANRVQVVFRVILPYLYPAWLIGFGMAFARAIGEYGSVVFIAGNMPMKTEIASLLIITKLTQYDYGGAAAIAFVLLLLSFCCCSSSTRSRAGARSGWGTDCVYRT